MKYIIVATRYSDSLILELERKLGKGNFYVRLLRNADAEELYSYLEKNKNNALIVLGRGEKIRRFYYGIINNDKFPNFHDKIEKWSFLGFSAESKDYIVRNLKLAGAEMLAQHNNYIVIKSEFEVFAKDLKAVRSKLRSRK